MNRNRDDAFVLDTLPLGEADRIVALLTEQHGKVRAVARGARRSRRRFGGLLEPLTRVRATWIEREGRGLHGLERLEGVRSFAAMQAEPILQAACAVLADVATAFCHEGQADPQTFRLIAAVLDALERGGAPRPLLRYFEYWTLRVHGLLPDLEACFVCGRALPAARPIRVSPGHGARCSRCPPASRAREVTLRATEMAFLDATRRLPPASLSAATRELRCGAAIETLLRGTLEAFAERRFRTYRHFKAAEGLPTGGGRG